VSVILIPKIFSFILKLSYTDCFIKAEPAWRYLAFTNLAVHDGPEIGDGEGTAKAVLASDRAQAGRFINQFIN